MKALRIAIATVAVALLPLAPAGATYPGENGKILYVRYDGRGSDPFAIDADGSNRARLANTVTSEVDAVYSPDGTKIAFTYHLDGGSEIYVMNADGTGLTAVTSGPLLKRFPEWSPDGTRLAYMAKRRRGGSMIFVKNVDGTGKTRLTAKGGHNTHPKWSPDGTRIAYVHWGRRTSDIYVMNPDGANKSNLTATRTYEAGPSWSPTGTEIAYERSKNNSFGFDVFAVDLDGNRRALSRIDGLSEEAPRFSPNGELVSYLECGRRAGCSLVVINADGSGRRKLADISDPSYALPDGMSAVWSPDSTKLAYSGMPGSRYLLDLYVVEVADGEVTRLSNTPGLDEIAASWQ
ncbi:MAG: hypothetical protein GEU71_14180, partial [Actinobacteria bacterium]|nr:hypothetical protein [Actinomycetota bacterium]